MDPFFIPDNFASISIEINKIEICKPTIIVINDMLINYTEDSYSSKYALKLTIYLIEIYRKRGAYLGQNIFIFNKE